MKKIKTQKFIIGGTALLLFLAMLAGCKKQGQCPDGIQYLDNMENTTKTEKAKSDLCEFERNEVYRLESDSASMPGKYCDENGNGGDGLRGAIWPALNVPEYGWAPQFWAKAELWPYERDNILDTAKMIVFTIDKCNENPSHPIHSNDSTMNILYGKCGEFITTCTDLELARKALTDCESGVGIHEWRWVEDSDNPCVRIWRKVR
jgi:hypothetical protein